MPSGTVVVAGLAGGVSFGRGADGVQVGVGLAEPGQPQFFADVPGRPGGLGRVGIADQPQAAVGHGTDDQVRPRARGRRTLRARRPAGPERPRWVRVRSGLRGGRTRRSPGRRRSRTPWSPTVGGRPDRRVPGRGWLTAQVGAVRAACWPRRSLRSSIMAAISAR